MRGRPDRAEFVQPNFPGITVGEAADQVVVDAVKQINRLGNAMDALQCLVGKNRALVNFNCDDHRIGTTKCIAYLVMELNIRMFLGQQICKIGGHANCGKLEGKKHRGKKHQQQDGFGPGKNPLINFYQVLEKFPHHTAPGSALVIHIGLDDFKHTGAATQYQTSIWQCLYGPDERAAAYVN